MGESGKSWAERKIKQIAKSGKIIFETEGTAIICKCKKCGWKTEMTFFLKDYNVERDAGPCGECGEWAMEANKESNGKTSFPA